MIIHLICLNQKKKKKKKVGGAYEERRTPETVLSESVKSSSRHFSFKMSWWMKLGRVGVRWKGLVKICKMEGGDER